MTREEQEAWTAAEVARRFRDPSRRNEVGFVTDRDDRENRVVVSAVTGGVAVTTLGRVVLDVGGVAMLQQLLDRALRDAD